MPMRLILERKRSTAGGGINDVSQDRWTDEAMNFHGFGVLDN